MLSGTGWVQDVGIHDMASFPFVVRWLSVDPATYVLCLSRWIATPLCLCTDIWHVCLHFRGNNYTVCIRPYSSRLAIFKCGGLLFHFCANAAIYPQFWVWVGFNSYCGHNISYSFPVKLSHRIHVFVNIILPGYPVTDLKW
jgi:hypothetical protein